MDCINLRERFGDRYRVAFDPAYDPKHRPREKLDPWYMTIPCERGEIYPYGPNSLAVEVEGRPVTARRLRELHYTTTIQQGDHFLACTFPSQEFEAVAELVKPRKRRQASERQRETARQNIRKARESLPQGTHSEPESHEAA